jgi:Asp-tRNA(Asn)/Glu-tRNA(Gln) amidotransferase A subunit family amidase
LGNFFAVQKQRDSSDIALKNMEGIMRFTRIAAGLAAVLTFFPLPLSVASSVYPVEETSIAGLEAAYVSGQTTAHAVTQAFLDRIDAYDKRGPLINSLITINPRALEEADRLDALLKTTGKLIGPLHGIPVIVKDNIDVAGLPMTSGFQGWKNYVPPSDATIVKKIRKAGGIILAKSSLSEFALGLNDSINSMVPGFVRNPYNTAFASGGSSGGTGASVAANFGVVGLGSDTGGSVRVPSAFNALAGLRPTVGLVSRTGLVPFDSVRDTPGPMARTVTDMAILLDVIVGADAEDAATSRAASHIAPSYVRVLKTDALKGARLGVLRQIFKPTVTDPRIIAHFETTLAELKAAGAEIVDPVVVPEIDSISDLGTQTPAHFKDDLTRWIAKHPGVPFPSIKAIADSRLVYPRDQATWNDFVGARPVEEDPATIRGARDEQRYRDAFTKAMDISRIDAVIFPSWTQLPQINGASLGGAGCCLTFVGSSLRWPELSVPSGYLGEGLPQGLEILGRAWDEAKITGYAYAYERATHHRRPPPTVPPLAESVANRFIGTWQLVTIRERDGITGVERPAAQSAGGGQLIYAANGRVSVQIARAGREKLPSESAASFASYFGRWELAPADRSVVHYQDGNLNAAQVGQKVKQYYSFDADGHLVLTTPPTPDNTGREVSTIFVWERLP